MSDILEGDFKRIDEFERACKRYKRWCFDKVLEYKYDKNPSSELARKWSELFEILWRTEYIWREDLVAQTMDDNLAADGRYLRVYFVQEMENLGKKVDLGDHNDWPASVFEALLGLSWKIDDRLTWDSDIGAQSGKYFWIFLENLGLNKYTNYRIRRSRKQSFYEINDILYTWMERRYGENGEGSIMKIEGLGASGFGLNWCNCDEGRVKNGIMPAPKNQKINGFFEKVYINTPCLKNCAKFGATQKMGLKENISNYWFQANYAFIT